MSVKSQQKTTLPHEAVELLTGNNNQIAITGPQHQITTINTEELESTAHTVMFTTTETSVSAAVAVPTTWGQRQGVLLVLAKSQECLRYYGSDAAAKGLDIANSPVWYRARRPILNITVNGVLAVLQTASEYITLMSDAVTCREVAVQPITGDAASKTKTTIVRAALTPMARGAATFIVATVNANTQGVNANVIEVAAYNITSASMTCVSKRSIAKTPLALAHIAINPVTGVVAVPVYNDETKSSVGLTFVNALDADEAPQAVATINNSVKKVISIAALANKRWLVIAPVTGNDDANAAITVVSADGDILTADEVLIGNDHNSTTNKLDKKLVTGVLPSGRVLVLHGHAVHTLKISLGKPATTAVAADGTAATAKPATSLAAMFKSKAATAQTSASSSRLAQWSTLVDANPTDVYAILGSADDSDDKVADAIVNGLINLNDLPELAAGALAQLPFVDWYRAAKAVRNVHTTLKVIHLLFLSALKRGAISVCTIAARAFDALYTLTGDDESSAPIAYELRHCLQQISTWANEQMGKQIGVVTVHCTGKSPAIKQAMFVPHQPFAVSVKRTADIDRREYTTLEPTRQR